MDNKETNTNKKKKDNRYRSVLNLPKSSLSVKRVGNPFDYSKNWILVFNDSLQYWDSSSFHPNTLVRGEEYDAE